ncbi:MAG: sugar porter family MFS transporter [Bacteroidota bacterium]
MKKNKLYVVGISLVASLGGLLFGFDTAVISGAEKTIQEIFQLNSFWHGFTIAIALIGTLVGALLAAKPADTYGRKKALIAIALLYGVSAIGSALAQNWFAFLFFRFIGGLGVGASSVIGPMYIAEIAPAKIRGRLVASFQLNIVIGQVGSYLSNYFIAQLFADNAWRWMLGMEFIPAVLFFLLLLTIPESPRWLVLKNRISEAKSLLEKLGSADASRELDEIKESVSSFSRITRDRFFSSKNRIPIMLAILVAVFNQMSGINAVIYYAPRIFEMVGFAKDSALLQSVSIGVSLLISVIAGMVLVDRIGRKKLLMIGSVGMMFFLAMVARTILSPTDGSLLMLISLVGFILFFGFTAGTVIWVYISEIFPNTVRAKGQTLGSFTHWAVAVIISWLFPVIVEGSAKGGGIVFSVFSASMVVMFFTVWKVFPETKEKSLEEIQKEFITNNNKIKD